MFLDKIGRLFATPMKKRRRRKMLFDLLRPKMKLKIERRMRDMITISELEKD